MKRAYKFLLRPTGQQTGVLASCLPGRNVAAKTGLNRSTLDAGWRVFLTVLAAKAESAGRTLIAVNPAQHLPHLPQLRALRCREPRHSSCVPLPRVRLCRTRRHGRG